MILAASAISALLSYPAAAAPCPRALWSSQEPARAGRLDPEAAEALGVPKGKDFARLKAGEAVMVGDKIIRPEQVCGQQRMMGRPML